MRHRSSAAIPLSRMACGSAALFERTDLPPGERGMLEAVGLHGGARLRVRQGGDSCVIQIGTTRLAVAGPAARRILVRPLPADGGG
jgi:Fe2+ transport system protein FeoA